MAIECLIFDLNKSMVKAFDKNIEDFLVEKCGMNEDKALSIRNELHTTHGTTATLRGLRALGHNIDPDEFYNFVHGRLPYEVIKSDPQLQILLQSIKQKKTRFVSNLKFSYWVVYVLQVFTNSRRHHAMKIIEKLGFQDCIDDYISFETLNKDLQNQTKAKLIDEHKVVQKPSIESMKIALDFVQVEPHCVLYIDDDEDNFAAAKSVGFRTVLVKKKVSKEADYAVENLVDLKQVIPELGL
ncbi:hypothetical protein MKW92_026265 [Papaver armeniacum]|nr:hypothetical protein MKW92_026265 [Papaver armeniacum]